MKPLCYNSKTFTRYLTHVLTLWNCFFSLLKIDEVRNNHTLKKFYLRRKFQGQRVGHVQKYFFFKLEWFKYKAKWENPGLLISV